MYLKILAWCVFSLVGDFGSEKSHKISRASFRCRSQRTVAGVMLCPWDIALRGSCTPVMPGAQEALQQPASCIRIPQTPGM